MKLAPTVEEAEEMAESEGDEREEFEDDLVMVDYVETKLDRQFKSLLLDSKGQDANSAFDAMGVGYLVKYIDKKVSRKVNNGIQSAINIVLKKSIKFCDHRI